MKFLYTILIFLCFSANATNYYVKASGGTGSGLDDANAWSYAHFNSAVLAAGDSVFFKRGDTFNGSPTVSSTGTISSRIYYGSYGIGVKPLFTAFESITLADQGGNIWSGTASLSMKGQNTVLINGKMGNKARYPNSGYLNSVSFPSKSQLIVPHSATDYTGYGIAIRCANWVIDQSKIDSIHVGVTNDTLYLKVQATYNDKGGYYFLQSNPALLDTLNEYSFDSATNTLSVYATSQPTVMYSTIDTLVKIKKKSYITFNGLSFTGSNLIGIQSDSLRGLVIENCVLENMGGYGIHALSTNGNQVKSDTFRNILSNGAHSDPDTSILYENNYLKNIAILDGMAMNGNSKGIGLSNQGHYHGYVNNHIDSVGYMGIYWKGKHGRVDSNFVNHHGFSKQDGGGVYTFQGLGLPYNFDTGTVVKNNIVLNGRGNYLNHEVYSFYNDDLAMGVSYENNTSAYSDAQGFFVKGSYIRLMGNTVLDTNRAGCVFSNQYFGSTPFHFTFKSNIFYTNASDGFTHGSVIQMTGLKDSLETIDSNYSFKPNAPTRAFNRGGFFGTYYSFAQWQSEFLYDLNGSSTLPSSRTSGTPTLFYNNTLSDSIVSLSGVYKDVRNVTYVNNAVIKPYESKLLFPATLPVKGRVKSLIFH